MKSRKVDASRFAVVALSIIIQAVLAWLIIYTVNKVFVVAQIIAYAIGVILFLSIVNRDQPAVYKIPWIILFLLAPFAGLMVYITFGNRKLTPRQKKKFRRIFNENNDGYYNQEKILKDLEEDGGKGLGLVRYLRSATSLPVFSDSTTEYIPTGEKFYAKLKEELKKCEKYVFMEYFIVQDGVMLQGILDILKEKIKRGVSVYFMYDDVGSMSKVPPKFDKTLQKLGINAVIFNKFYPIVSISHNNRDHRKITVIDGKVGFISGGNIADEYINETTRYGVWRDNAVCVKGQAVDSIVRLFIQLYNMTSAKDLKEEDFIYTEHETFSDGFVFPFGDDPSPITYDHISETTYLEIINQSKKYLYIATPYFIVDTNITDALKRASRRGVDVRIIIPEIPDKKIIYMMTKSALPGLIEAGVKAYKFKDGFMHSKTVLSDGDVAVVGTANFDFRSFVHHFECAVLLYKTASLNALYDDFCILFGDEGEQIGYNQSKLKWYESLIKSVFNLFAPLM